MRAFHNSRNCTYRSPYGAIELGTSTTLSIDVDETPNAAVQLRTWVDGQGESLIQMEATPLENGGYRFTTDLKPDAVGIVWYHFIITDENGTSKRYGAADGKTGGIGQLRDWEPPSFQLTVYDDPQNCPTRDDSDRENSRSLLGPVSRYLLGTCNAPELVEVIESLRENYPAETFCKAFDMLSGHTDTYLLMLLSGLAPYGQPRDESRTQLLDDHHLGMAKGRLWCASLIQMLAPNGNIDLGAGDQTVKHEDDDCEAILTNASDLRRSLPLFTDGTFECFAANDDTIGFWRNGTDGTKACVLVNGTIYNAHDVLVPMRGQAVSEVIAGYGVPVVDAAQATQTDGALPAADRYAQVHLYQLGSAILYFHPEQQLQREMEPGLGVLAHITSTPTNSPNSRKKKQAPGTLGAPACAFVDFLAESGMRYWQVLPVNPTDEFGSPYAGISAFAGNTALLENGPSTPSADDLATERAEEYLAFCKKEADWLEPYAAFMAIRQKLGKRAPRTGKRGKAGKTALMWQDWPEEYKTFNPKLIEDDDELTGYAEAWRRAQFNFQVQWEDLRSYANERGVQIIGDMPIYVSADSSDVWANPEMFQLGSDGKPAVVAGCPPDSFAPEGQIWGNPVYDWDTVKTNGYSWWLRRLERAFELYDIVRLDHFIGFARYYSIPAGEKATEGTYRPGPGIKLFEAAEQKFGPLPVIAEDLGSITPAVRALVAACGFPGMDIVQFVDGNDPLSGYQPRPGKIAYTGTHDNQTLRGYALDRYQELDDREVADELMEAVATCQAAVSILPLQDIMGLDDDARMNVPGVADGNWRWQADARNMEKALAKARELVELHEARQR